MTWDRDSAVSIRSTIGFARENARSMREVVSIEAWETVNELYLWMESAEAANLYETSRFEHYFGVRRRTQLCLGLLRSTMLHDEPLDFIWLGVMLERVRTDRAHPRRPAPRLQLGQQPSRGRRDLAVAVAPALAVGLRAVHEAVPG
jgi:uncharacterized alpha-E superfamily protein